MMARVKCLFFICMSALAVAACDDSASKSGAQVGELERIVKADASTVDESNIYFEDGTGIAFNGKVVREERFENGKGTYQRYVLEVPASLASLEGATFSVLAKAGYTRQVRKEEPSLFSVTYRKKGFPGILANYRELKSSRNGKLRAQLVLTWRVGD